MKRLLPILLLATLTAGCASFGLTPQQRQVLEDPQGIEKLDAEIAKLPEGAGKEKLKSIRAKLGDAKSYEEVVEKAVSDYAPYGLGSFAVLAWHLWRRSQRKDAVIAEIVEGVENGPKTPESKTSLAIATSKDTKQVIANVKAKLPKAPDVVVVPALVTK